MQDLTPLHEPLPDGASAGSVVKLEPLLDDYYAAQDWERRTGWPSRKKLTELNLEKDRHD